MLLLERVRVVAGLRVDAPLAREVVEALLAGRAALLPAEDGGVRLLERAAERDEVAVGGGGAPVADGGAEVEATV